MYEIFAGDLLIHSDITPLDSKKAINPHLTLEDSGAGSLEFTLPPINDGYSQDVLKRMVTDVRVECNGEWLWSGRVLQDAWDFWNNRKIVCEGELAYLNDSVQPPHKYNAKDPDTQQTSTTIRLFLESLITNHNAQVNDNRKFRVGQVTVTDGDTLDDSDAIYRFTNYESTLQCINEKLVEKLKGHIRVRHAWCDETQRIERYIDYISDDSLGTNSQVIRFGVNLLDYSKNIDMSELATTIVPRGNRLELDESDPRYIEGLEPYLTVEELGPMTEDITKEDGTVVTETWHDDKSMFVKNPTAVSNFGYVSKVVDWPDVTTAETLYNKAVKYLKDEQYEKMVLELQALDLKYISDEQPIRFLTKIRCISEPHGMDRTFILSKLDLDLTNPGNSLYTLGTDVNLTLTQANSQASSSVNAKIDALPSKSEILRSAEKNAYQMINGIDGSYVHFITNKSGSIDRIIISDGPTLGTKTEDPDHPGRYIYDFPDSLNLWIWSAGGLGHMKRQGPNGSMTYQDPWQEEMDVAMTMDGSIVADMITTGTMLADRILGGRLRLGYWPYTNPDTGQTYNIGGVAEIINEYNETMVTLDSRGVYVDTHGRIGSEDGLAQLYMERGGFHFSIPRPLYKHTNGDTGDIVYDSHGRPKINDAATHWTALTFGTKTVSKVGGWEDSPGILCLWAGDQGGSDTGYKNAIVVTNAAPGTPGGAQSTHTAMRWNRFEVINNYSAVATFDESHYDYWNDKEDSDERIKKDFKDITYEESINVISQLKPKSYKFNGINKKDTTKTHIGFIAQEVQKIDGINDGITEKNLEDYYDLHYNELIPHLVNVVKQQQKEIELLKKEINHG